MIPLVGYVDRFSARPGGRIEVKVSSTLTEPYQADLVRIIHGDANPAGPGIKLIELSSTFAGSYASRFQPVHQGSCGAVFSTGSITFCGALSHNNYANKVSRMLENVLTRFTQSDRD